jgi:transcriptional regulator with XRE-family HTH domain
MATVDDTMAWSNSTPEPPNAGKTPRRLHRIATVRQQQGISLRTVARQMQKDVATLRRQEDATTDLTLSDLLAWQEVLRVPLADLLEDPDVALSRPVLDRARLVRLMKTVASIKDLADSKRVQRMASMLADQLCEIMPELREVSPWHSVGQRRSLNEYGQVMERRISEDWFRQHHED